MHGKTRAGDDGAPAYDTVPDIRPIPRIAVQAFCDTRETAALVEAAAADRRMMRTHTKAHMGGMQGAVEFYHSAPTPNLVILESQETRDAILAHLDQLAEVCDPGSKVVVIGHVNDVVLYRELLRRGVSEYLVAPVALFDLLKVISDLYAGPEASPLGRTVAFVGAKGGCGASVVCHNVAWTAARTFDSDVAIADLDLPWGTAGLDFNQDPNLGTADAVFSPDRLDEVYLDRLLAKCADRLNLLAAPATLDRNYDLDELAFDPLFDIVRTNLPLVVLDVPHVWTAWSRRLLRSVDEVVLVAEPDLPNLRNAKNIIDHLRQNRPNDAPVRLVLNRVGLPKRPEIKAEEFAKALETPVVATIPFDAHLFGTASNNGQMIAEADPKHATCELFRSIAVAVTGRAEVKKQRRSAFAPILEKLRGRKAS